MCSVPQGRLRIAHGETLVELMQSTICHISPRCYRVVRPPLDRQGVVVGVAVGRLKRVRDRPGVRGRAKEEELEGWPVRQLGKSGEAVLWSRKHFPSGNEVQKIRDERHSLSRGTAEQARLGQDKGS